MKQNKNNLLIQQPDSNTPPQTIQDVNQLTEALTAAKKQEEEITETTAFRNKGDYGFLRNSKSRTFNQNIKIRNQ
ncbi:MAG: hypothetical protein ABI855_05155 [Bacteroidota bacterium]